MPTLIDVSQQMAMSNNQPARLRVRYVSKKESSIQLTPTDTFQPTARFNNRPRRLRVRYVRTQDRDLIGTLLTLSKPMARSSSQPRKLRARYVSIEGGNVVVTLTDTLKRTVKFSSRQRESPARYRVCLPPIRLRFNTDSRRRPAPITQSLSNSRRPTDLSLLRRLQQLNGRLQIRQHPSHDAQRRDPPRLARPDWLHCCQLPIPVRQARADWCNLHCWVVSLLEWQSGSWRKYDLLPVLEWRFLQSVQ